MSFKQRSRKPQALAFAVLAALTLAAGSAGAQDLQQQLERKQQQLEEAKQRKGVLTTEISRYSKQIDRLRSEVAELRNREAKLQTRLVQVERRLAIEEERLQILRRKLRRALAVLSERLVEIYKSDEPDVLTVILDSEGFDDLISRYDYLSRVQRQDATLAHRVRELRDEAKRTVERIRAARDELEARKAELVRTRAQLEQREAALESAVARKERALSSVRSEIHKHEGDISKLNARIQAQLQAQASTTTSDPLPAGPIRGGSGGMIWPVNGPVVSPFGPRWGRLHAGVDIAVPAGTPIRAAKAGRIVLAAPTSGYGNYTCIDHGGGLSTCYAHQSRYAITSGSVSQGQVIGYVGCTGHCYGDHLHFEVRVNGAPVDPMGYL